MIPRKVPPLAIAVLAVALIVFWRSHLRLFAPVMQVEDGASIFAYFYERREWSALFRFKGGYIPFIPNLLGYLFVRLPASWNPYLFGIVPTLFAVVAYSWFALPRYRVLVPDDRLRALTVVAVALAPVAQFFLISHTDFSIWNALYLILIWSCLPFADGTLRALGAFSVQQALVWTNPLSFVAAPLNLLHFVEQRSIQQRLLQLGMLVSHGLHMVYGLAGRKNGPAERVLSIDSEMLLRLYKQLVEGELFQASFGPILRGFVDEHAPFAYPLFGGLVCLLLAWALWKPSPYVSRRVYLLFLYVIVALTWVILVSRSDSGIAHGRRYVYVQLVFCVMLVCILFGQLVGAWFLRGAQLAGGSPSVRRYGFLYAYPSFVVLWFALQNAEDRGVYEPHPERNVKSVRDCMRSIEEQEARNGGACGVRVTCKKRRDWTIKIRMPRCSSGE